MNKPITVAKQEFVDKIIEIINNSDLPAFIMANEIAKIQIGLDQLAAQQYETDKEAYEKEIKNKNVE